MSRTKGAVNKALSLPVVYTLTVDERIEMIASIILDIVSEELCKT
jgi:hypothetical protein